MFTMPAVLKDMFYSTLPLEIPANSTKLKVISCLPLLGTLCSLMQQHSLKNHIATTTNPLYRIELIEAKNHYKTADIIRECVQIALTIVMIAVEILTPWYMCSLGLFGTELAFAAYGKYHNEQLIDNLLKGYKGKIQVL